MRPSTSLASAVIALLSITTCVTSNPITQVAQFFPQYNSQRVKIRYGPFTTHPKDVDNGMTSFMEMDAQKPCIDCIITFAQPGLEYEDGTIADADTDLWLHHAIMFNQNRINPVCPGQAEKMLASGNERTAVNICANGTYEAGYYLGLDDSIGLSTELMNMATAPQTAYVTVTWEYITQSPPTFSRVKVLWLDVGGCNGNAHLTPKSTTQAFEFKSPDWVSDIRGKITFMGGHLHDGGTHLNIKKNGVDHCDCFASYGASSEGISVHSGTSTSTTIGNAHISDISICKNMNDIMVEPGDLWSVTAHYDPTQHGLMINTDGTVEPVMGIAMAYVADKDVVSRFALNSQTLAGHSSLWMLGVLMVAVSAFIYIFRPKDKWELEDRPGGYRLLQRGAS